jgi:hypothetical protein
MNYTTGRAGTLPVLGASITGFIWSGVAALFILTVGLTLLSLMPKKQR